VVGVVAVLLVSGVASAQTPTAPKEPPSALLDGWDVTQFEVQGRPAENEFFG
jgi:hypothetical protein